MTIRARCTFGRRFSTGGVLLGLLSSGSAVAQAPPPADGAATTPKPSAVEPAPAPANGRADAAHSDDLQKQLADQQKHTADLETRLQAAEETLIQAEARQDDSKIRLYGFTDVGFRKAWIPEKSVFKNIIDDSATFILGSSNLYLEAQPHPRLRSLTEVRFTLYPNGVPGPDFQPSQSATIYDATSATGRNKVAWSGIVLERAVLEWKQSDALKVMAGYFLTPYGIWNVDHGSPTLISSALPGFFAGEYFPTHLTGLQLLGAATTGDWELGYRAYLTNGRARVLFDNQNGKLIGGRLYATGRFGWGSLTLGSSGFTGTYLEKAYKIDTDRTFHVESKPILEYAEWGAAADLALDAGPLRIRSEFVLNRTDYTNGLRAPVTGGGYYPDRSRWDTYVLAAYRLPWLGLEPYFYGDCDRKPDSTSERSVTLSGGLNINLTAAARIKLQYFRVMLLGVAGPDPTVNDFDLFDARFVLAY